MFGPRTIQSADISAKTWHPGEEEEEEVVCLVASYFRSKFGIRQKDLFKKRGYIYIKGYVYTTYILHWTSLRRETLISFLPSPFLFVNFLFLSRLALISSGCSTFILGFKSKERLKLKFSFPDCWYLVGSWSLSLFCFFASDIPPFSYVVFMQCSVHIHGTDYVFQVWMSESFRPSFHLSFSFFFSFYIAISSFIFGRAPSVLIIYSLPVSYFLSSPPTLFILLNELGLPRVRSVSLTIPKEKARS
jgi:hypothetical protein